MNRVFLSGDEEIVFTDDLLGIPDKHPYTIQLTLLKLVRLLFEVRDWVIVDRFAMEYLQRCSSMYGRSASYSEMRDAARNGYYDVQKLFASMDATLVMATTVDHNGSDVYRVKIDDRSRISGKTAAQMWMDDIWNPNLEKI